MNEIYSKPSPDLQELVHSRRTSKRTLYWIGGVCFVVAMLLLGYRFFFSSATQANPEFVTAPVSEGDLKVTVTATGTLYPVNQVDIGSELSGTVRSVEVNYNDLVQKGQVLAKLDTERLQARIAQSQATLETAKAKLMEAKSTLDEAKRKMLRLDELAKAQLCALEDCEAGRANYQRAIAIVRSAEAQVALATASLEADQADMRKTLILSPIQGVVLKRNVEPGQTVAASFQTPVLFTIAEDLKKMELRVAVDEADVGKVEEKQIAQFSVDAYPKRTFDASIAQIRLSPKTVEGVVTYETVLSVDNGDLLLRPGMTATAEILIQHKEKALLIPNAALRFRPSLGKRNASANNRNPVMSLLMPRAPREKQARTSDDKGDSMQKIWILKNGQAQDIKIQTGASDGKVTEVLGGELHSGDAVIIDTRTTRS